MTKSSFITTNNSKYPLNNIGDVVATDSIPIKSYGSKYDTVNLFIDSLSGHCTVIFGKKNDGSKELSQYFNRVVMYNKNSATKLLTCKRILYQPINLPSLKIPF